MKRPRLIAPTSIASAVLSVLFPLVSVQACGPDFHPDIFVRQLHPDHPKQYAAGKLGVLLASFPRADLAVAYRYLNGGRLTAQEQSAYHPLESLAEMEGLESPPDGHANGGQDARQMPVETADPAGMWLAARNRFLPPQSDVHDAKEYGATTPAGTILASDYEICQADAFRTAVATLESRAKTWGPQSTFLANWIQGQDAVFSNCSSDTDRYYLGPNKTETHPRLPAAVPSGAPLLLRQDRAYQIAAAQFYASQFVPARAGFQAIASDKDSPWRGIAAYLVARCLVRQAFLTAPPSNGPDDNTATFNPDLMKQAQQQLESIRGRRLPSISEHGIQSMLNLVRLRTEPKARLAEISAALAGPKADPYYSQDLNDLTWYLNSKLDSLAIRPDASEGAFQFSREQGDLRPLTTAEKQAVFNHAYAKVADLRSASPLIDWLITFQSPATAAKQHAFAEWQRTQDLPWLVASLSKAVASDVEAPVLIDASGRIPSTSPAWLTVTYHRDRLLLGTGRTTIAGVETTGIEAAGIETDALMPFIQKQGSDSATNLFRGLRMRSAVTLDDALADAPRKILARVSEEQSALAECLNLMKNPKRHYDCKPDTNSLEFSEDAAELLNDKLPLATMAQAAQSKSLPSHLRSSVATVAWVRAVLLKDENVAEQMLPLLPKELRRQAGPGVGFHALMAIARNPGLRPYLDAGVQRSASWDFVESYGDNWWCANWPISNHEADQPLRSDTVAFLAPEARVTAASEHTDLIALGGAEEYIGGQILDYAHSHPEDPDIPEALYVTLRLIRYGCYHGWRSESARDRADRVRVIALSVGAMMRHRYPDNQWTKKAAPYVWPVEPHVQRP